MTRTGDRTSSAVVGSDMAIAAVIADPAVSYWVRAALRGAQTRDPLDAANDAALVARLLSDRVDALLGGASAG